MVTDSLDINSHIKDDINSVIRKHGLTIDDLVKCGKDGLMAERVIKDRDGDEVDRVPDWNVRHKFFSSFLELLGYLKGNGTVVNNMVVGESKRLGDEAYNRLRG